MLLGILVIILCIYYMLHIFSEKKLPNDYGKIINALYRSFCSEIIFQKIHSVKINQIFRAATLNIYYPFLENAYHVHVNLCKIFAVVFEKILFSKQNSCADKKKSKGGGGCPRDNCFLEGEGGQGVRAYCL